MGLKETERVAYDPVNRYGPGATVLFRTVDPMLKSKYCRLVSPAAKVVTEGSDMSRVPETLGTRADNSSVERLVVIHFRNSDIVFKAARNGNKR